jgi:hypothetical protein
MARTACIFCGAPADSREHLFPDWVGEEFRRRFGPVDVRDRTGPYGTIIGAPKVNIRIKCVCADCNNGW